MWCVANSYLLHVALVSFELYVNLFFCGNLKCILWFTPANYTGIFYGMKAVLSYYHSSMKTKNRLRDVDHLLMVPFMHVAAPNISKYVFYLHYKYYHSVGLYYWDFLFKYTQCVIQYLHSPLFVCNEALEKRHLHDAIKLTCHVEIDQVLTHWINEINRTMNTFLFTLGNKMQLVLRKSLGSPSRF